MTTEAKPGSSEFLRIFSAWLESESARLEAMTDEEALAAVPDPELRKQIFGDLP